MRVKICGITRSDDALLCERYGADALGFIFYPRSKRYISHDKAYDIIKHLSPFIVKIGVFVNENPDKINTIASQIGLNCIQLHGEEPSQFVKKINLPVIKSFRINSHFDYTILKRYKGCSFLLDSYSADGYGGTGRSFDWGSIPMELRQKIILAGGISVYNIEEIFKRIKPEAVDISSSLELHPGKKDPLKIKEFFNIFNSLKTEYNGK